jgi:hypothetical protein
MDWVLMILPAGAGVVIAWLYASRISKLQAHHFGMIAAILIAFTLAVGIPVFQMLISRWIHPFRQHGDPNIIYLFVAEDIIIMIVILYRLSKFRHHGRKSK